MISFWLEWLFVEVFWYLVVLCDENGLNSFLMNAWIWQQVKHCFVVRGMNVITNQKLKIKKGRKIKPNTDLGLRQKEFTDSELSLCNIVTLYLLSNNTKAMGVNIMRLTKIVKQQELH